MVRPVWIGLDVGRELLDREGLWPPPAKKKT